MEGVTPRMSYDCSSGCSVSDCVQAACCWLKGKTSDSLSSCLLLSLAKFSMSISFSPEGAGGGLSAWITHGRLSLHCSPSWVVMGEHCPRSCSSYSGQCRHIQSAWAEPFTRFRFWVPAWPCRPRSCSSYSGRGFHARYVYNYAVLRLLRMLDAVNFRSPT